MVAYIAMALTALLALGAAQPDDHLSLLQSNRRVWLGDDPDGECDAFANKFPDLVKVDFALSENTVNNLGGAGPQTGVAHEMYYTNVAVANAEGHAYDLRVSVLGDYTSSAKGFKNNGANGHYGVINVNTGTSVTLQFEFIDPSTNTPATLEKVFISWVDIDQGRFGLSEEKVILWPGYTDTLMSSPTEIVKSAVSCPGHTGTNCEAFRSSTHGTGKDNPENPMVLTAQQAGRTFSVLYEDVSKFKVTLRAGDGHGGRNFLFTGMSEIAFASVDTCCPTHICGCKAFCSESTDEWSNKCTSAGCAHCSECETTTTTTIGVPPTPVEVCENAATLEFSSGNLIENTLGDVTPTGTSGRLFFKNVVTHDGRALDLSISDASTDLQYLGKSRNFNTYTSLDRREYTGEYRGAGRIAVDQPGSYVFKFRLTDSETNAPVKLPLFPLVFYDIDGKGESIQACRVASAIGSEDSALEERYFEGCYTHFARGKEVNLPTNFEVLTKNQRKMTISYSYRNTAEWFIEVHVAESEKDRYIVFKGSKVLACDSEASVAKAWGEGNGKPNKGDV